MRLSEYKAGTILVDGDGKVFIHDGFINADDTWKDFYKIKKNYTFVDGVPFSVKVEE